MPQKPLSDRTWEHGQQIAALDARILQMRVDLDRLDANLLEARRLIHDVDKRLAVEIRNGEQIEQKLVEMNNRFDASFARRSDRRWSLIIALIGIPSAALGAILPELFKLTLAYLRH